jgi:hypothetical protein
LCIPKSFIHIASNDHSIHEFWLFIFEVGTPFVVQSFHLPICCCFTRRGISAAGEGMHLAFSLHNVPQAALDHLSPLAALWLAACSPTQELCKLHVRKSGGDLSGIKKNLSILGKVVLRLNNGVYFTLPSRFKIPHALLDVTLKSDNSSRTMHPSSIEMSGRIVHLLHSSYFEALRNIQHHPSYPNESVKNALAHPEVVWSCWCVVAQTNFQESFLIQSVWCPSLCILL